MDKSTPRKRLVVAGSCFGAAILLSLLCLIPVVLTSRNRLSVVGHRVTDASVWVRTYDGYYWDSNATQVVHLDTPKRPSLRVDDRTARTVSIAPITLTEPGVNWTPRGGRPSPDGKWLLFGHGGSAYFVAFEVATGRFVKWKPSTRSLTYSLWYPDSRRWVEFDQGADGKRTQPILHSLDGPDRRTAAISDTFVWPIGITAGGHILNARNDGRLELWEYDLEEKSLVPLKRTVALPSGASLYEVEGSPDGSQVAYLIQEKTNSLVAQILERLLHTSRNTSQNFMSLWVSRSDGTDLRRIGFERASTASGVQWAPDGKRLSLFLDNDFYIIPLD